MGLHCKKLDMREDSRGKEGQKKTRKTHRPKKGMWQGQAEGWRGNTEFTDVEKEGDKDQRVGKGCHGTKTRRSNRTMTMRKQRRRFCVRKLKRKVDVRTDSTAAKGPEVPTCQC